MKLPMQERAGCEPPRQHAVVCRLLPSLIVRIESTPRVDRAHLIHITALPPPACEHARCGLFASWWDVAVLVLYLK